MPTLILENIPMPLFERLQSLAAARHRTPAATVLEVLEKALPETAAEPSKTHAVRGEPPLPDEPFLTPEISAPFDIPWPKGEIVQAVEVANYLPEPHDIPDSE